GRASMRHAQHSSRVSPVQRCYLPAGRAKVSFSGQPALHRIRTLTACVLKEAVMGHCYHHALSSAKKWGGVTADYLQVHNWFDESKSITADFRHRALRHHAEGIFMLVTWTCKRGLIWALAAVVVPVVHRRGPPSAYRVSTRKRSGRRRGACGPTGG